MPEMKPPWVPVMNRIKDCADSAARFLTGNRKNSIAILKRLQREAFTDIMKLRERQEKFERVLSSFSLSKCGPFGEGTHVKGQINVAGALSFDHENARPATPDSAGVNTGIDSRFIFNTTVRQKDSLVAELATDPKYFRRENDAIGSPLALAKVIYTANIDNWSIISIPIGGKCDDFSTDPNVQEEQYLTGFSSLRPPLLNRHHNYATGLIFRSGKLAASFAELVSAKNAVNLSSFFSTFGQISYEVAEQTKLTMSGIWHGPGPFSQQIRMGNRVLSFGNAGASSLSRPATLREISPKGCIDVVLDVDEDSKIGGWIEVQRSNPRSLKWSISLCDSPKDELGWGACARGTVEGQMKQVQLESFLNFRLGKKAALLTGIVLTMDGRGCTPALVFRSSCVL